MSSDKAPLAGVKEFLDSTIFPKLYVFLCMLSVSFSLNILRHCLHGNLCSFLLCYFICVKSEDFSGQWLHSTLPWLPDTYLCVRSVWTLGPESV